MPLLVGSFIYTLLGLSVLCSWLLSRSHMNRMTILSTGDINDVEARLGRRCFSSSCFHAG